MQLLKRKYNVFWIACLVSVGGILYGYDMGVISGALLFIKNTIPMNDTQVGLIVGAVLAGGLLGTLIAGPLGDFFGRRLLIMLSALMFILGVFFILYANSFIFILSARLFLGIGVGMVAVAVPLYVTEIVPSKDRGKYITFFQLLLTFGIVLAYFVDLLFTPSGNWRGMFAVLLIPSCILFLGVLCLPESPRWLIANNQFEKAKKNLRAINNSDLNVEKEFQNILRNLNHSTGSWKEFFSKRNLRLSCVALAIAVFNQLTGINSFLQYAPIILKKAGIDSNVTSMLGSVGIGLLNFIFTLIAIALIDTWGRRPLLLLGILGVMCSEIYLGILSYFFSAHALTGVLSLIGLMSFIIFFAIGPGVVVWLAISELFPTRVRGKGIGLCLFFNSLAATALSVYFIPLVKNFGVGQTYWIFAFFSFCYLLVTFFFLPETKSKSLENIQENPAF